MKNFKSYLAFTLAIGLVLSSMVVFAAEDSDSVGDSSENVSISDNTVSSNSTGGSSGGGGSVERVEIDREAIRLEAEAAESGFENAAQMQLAQAGHKTAGEYYNNAVVTTAGIENAVPVAQGGQLIIDGEVTNASATVSKVSSVYVDSVRAAREGRLLNVVDVRFPAHEAVVNFYMPGIEAGDTVTAVQFTDGTWTDVEVVEVRTDHVLLKLMRSGVVAFLEK